MGEPAGHPFRGNQWTSNRTFHSRMGTTVQELADKVAAKGKQFLQKHLSLETVANMAGAPDDAEVTIDASDEELIVNVRSDKMWSQRTINLRARTILNDEIKINSEHQGKGLAAELLGKQIDAGRMMGMHRIECYAAGKGRNPGDGTGLYNGYYTWARLGYMPQHPVLGLHEITQQVMDRHGNRLNIIKLMATPEGRKYWQHNGAGFNAIFDLRPTSISSRVFDAYRKAKAKS